MKYIVMLGDGMADLPIEELGGKTPLQSAHKPCMDKLAKGGIVGMVKTVPDGMKPGSDVANLSAMGFDPLACYTGRSPLEAVSIGINLEETDIAFRCNLVTLSDEENYEDKTMVDYSSDEISTVEAAAIIKTVNEHLKNDILDFYAGISYRHCMVWHNGEVGLGLTPPHDISDKKIKDYLPKNEMILNLMKKSYDILKNHPINLDRVSRGLHPANSIWLWGEGTKPAVSNFLDTYNKKGSVISAVDLIKGIGISAGMNVIDVEGATGNINTNFEGKCQAAINELLCGQDMVYIHVEAPDECGHRGEIENKVKSIELIDSKILAPILEELEKNGEEYRVLLMPDHPTPICIKTHSSDPVPFVLYDSTDIKKSCAEKYDEQNCKQSGIYYEKGYELMGELLK